MNRNNILFVLALSSFTVLSFSLALYGYIYFSSFHLYAGQLLEFVEHHYWLSILAYVIIFIAAVIFFIPVTVVFTILSGFLFGVIVGTLLTAVSAMTGALILFFLIRYFIGGWVQDRFKNQLKKFNYEFEHKGARYLLGLQWFPFTPTPLINILAGVSTISWKTVAWTTFIGVLPGTLVYTWGGYQLRWVETPTEGLSIIITILLALIALFMLVPLVLQWRKNQGEKPEKDV